MNANDPAFPDPARSAEPTSSNQCPIGLPNGLTIREEIAKNCMNGFLSSGDQHGPMEYADLAHAAVLAADALIAELNKPKPSC